MLYSSLSLLFQRYFGPYWFGFWSYVFLYVVALLIVGKLTLGGAGIELSFGSIVLSNDSSSRKRSQKIFAVLLPIALLLDALFDQQLGAATPTMDVIEMLLRDDMCLDVISTNSILPIRRPLESIWVIAPALLLDVLHQNDPDVLLTDRIMISIGSHHNDWLIWFNPTLLLFLEPIRCPISVPKLTDSSMCRMKSVFTLSGTQDALVPFPTTFEILLMVSNQWNKEHVYLDWVMLVSPARDMWNGSFSMMTGKGTRYVPGPSMYHQLASDSFRFRLI